MSFDLGDSLRGLDGCTNTHAVGRGVCVDNIDRYRVDLIPTVECREFIVAVRLMAADTPVWVIETVEPKDAFGAEGITACDGSTKGDGLRPMKFAVFRGAEGIRGNVPEWTGVTGELSPRATYGGLTFGGKLAFVFARGIGHIYSIRLF